MSRRCSTGFALALALALALAPAAAGAEVGSAPFAPAHAQQLIGLEDFTFDSDWFPMDAPLQLRLIVHGGNSVEIDMPGAGLYDWAAGSVHFEGDPGAGRVDVDVGLTLDAKVRFDVLGLQWESDIIGPYDYAVITGDAFTPYLLPGNPERPVLLDDETDPVTLVSVPVTPDIIVAAGNLDIDVYIIVEGELGGQTIDVAAAAPSPQFATIAEEGAAAPLLAGPGPTPDPFVVDATLTCHLVTAPTIVLRPTLVMEILGMKFEVANIEVPIALPPFDDEIRFADVALEFPRPAPEPTTGGGDSHGGTGEDDGGATVDGATVDAGSTGLTATGATGDADSDSASGGADDPGDDGCGCRSDPAPAAPLLALVLLAARRRRTSAILAACPKSKRPTSSGAPS